MPQLYNAAVITDVGISFLNRAQAGEVSIQFTRMVVGNGVYREEEKALSELQKRTSLKSEKNSYPLSSVNIVSDNSVKLTAIITNQDLVTGETLVNDGYYINEMGLYAKEKDGDSSTEILYSIVITAGENGDYMPPYNGHTPAQIIQEYYTTISNSEDVTTYLTDTGAVMLAEDAEKRFQEIYEAIPPVDSELDTESENPVQNKVVAKKIKELNSDIENKVDKVVGKGLSTNDFTTEQMNKLAKVQEGAEANVQPDWNVTDSDSDAFIKNKPTIPIIPSSLPANGGNADTVDDFHFTASEYEIQSYINTSFMLTNESNVIHKCHGNAVLNWISRKNYKIHTYASSTGASNRYSRILSISNSISFMILLNIVNTSGDYRQAYICKIGGKLICKMTQKTGNDSGYAQNLDIHYVDNGSFYDVYIDTYRLPSYSIIDGICGVSTYISYGNTVTIYPSSNMIQQSSLPTGAVKATEVTSLI